MCDESASEHFRSSCASQSPSQSDGIPYGQVPSSPFAQAEGGPAPAGGPSAEAGEALSVTRLAPFTNQVDWKVLACGVDSLDVGFEVIWNEQWPQISEWLDAAKERAAGSQGIPSPDGRFLILPSGKPPNYRWHLQWPDFHLFIGRGQSARNNTPNVYASINAQALWMSSASVAVPAVVREIIQLGGALHRVKVSRCDLAADFLIPGGVPLQLLLDCRVPRQVKHSHNMTGDKLETFYQGAKKSPIQLRIYDKALEVRQGGTKYWFYDIWKVAPGAEVWRVEFQLRRQYLKQSSVNTVPDLMTRAGGMWKYLTNDWFSLRLNDDSNTSRRSIHPGWETVQASADKFGPELAIVRERSQQLASAEWYVNHCAGCLVGFGARQRLDNFESAAVALVDKMRGRLAADDYERQYAIKSIQLGHSASPKSFAESEVLKEMEFD